MKYPNLDWWNLGGLYILFLRKGCFDLTSCWFWTTSGYSLKVKQITATFMYLIHQWIPWEFKEVAFWETSHFSLSFRYLHLSFAQFSTHPLIDLLSYHCESCSPMDFSLGVLLITMSSCYFSLVSMMGYHVSSHLLVIYQMLELKPNSRSEHTCLSRDRCGHFDWFTYSLKQ